MARKADTWFNLHLSHVEQARCVDVFKKYVRETSGYSGSNLLNAIREDFSVASFSPGTVIANYYIYKRVKNFLEGNSVNVVNAIDGHTNVFKRVVFTIWPEDAFIEERKKAYVRMLDVRAAGQGKALTLKCCLNSLLLVRVLWLYLEPLLLLRRLLEEARSTHRSRVVLRRRILVVNRYHYEQTNPPKFFRCKMNSAICRCEQFRSQMSVRLPTSRRRARPYL